ncbi:hypothetical protein BDFG_07701 [Blastomyces dermatitidis ATCC 26199]|nr:hypothetical protein BDFG_07701 [Blastomyces dermatitidis ATCC 26199]
MIKTLPWHGLIDLRGNILSPIVMTSTFNPPKPYQIGLDRFNVGYSDVNPVARRQSSSHPSIQSSDWCNRGFHCHEATGATTATSKTTGSLTAKLAAPTSTPKMHHLSGIPGPLSKNVAAQHRVHGRPAPASKTSLPVQVL